MTETHTRGSGTSTVRVAWASRKPSATLFLSPKSIRVPRFDRSTTSRRLYFDTAVYFVKFFTISSPFGTLIVHRRICMINHRASRAGIDRSVKRTMTNASVTNLVVQNASSASELCISGTAAVQIACACRSSRITLRTCPNYTVRHREINYRRLQPNYICHFSVNEWTLIEFWSGVI